MEEEKDIRSGQIKYLIQKKKVAKRRQLVCVQLSFPGREFGQQLEELSGWSQCRCCPLLREGRAPGLSRVVGQEWRGLCPPVTDPVPVTLPNTTLAFTSRIFCSLISSSGSFQPREISLQVPALNPLTRVTLSVFPELWKSQRICCKAPSLQMRMSGLIWRESRNSPKEIPPRYMVVLEKKTKQTQISCWNHDA